MTISQNHKTQAAEKQADQLYFVSKGVGKAIAEYEMLQAGDKVMVAISGGKDSLSLLHLLKYRKTFVPIDFEIKAVHVDMGFPDFPLDKLIQHLEQSQIDYHIEPLHTYKGKSVESIDCFSCSRERRKALFELADKMGFNKIALGHHLDDIAETILMNQFFRGEIGAMCPKQELFDGKLTLIRPLTYVKEKDIKLFAKEKNILDIVSDYKCPNDDLSKRRLMKDLLTDMEQHNPSVKKNIINSLKNIKKDYLL